MSDAPVLDERVFESHPLLAKLDEDARKLVLKSSSVTRYRQGRLVIKQGDAPRAFCLLEGAARVFHTSGEKEVLVKLFRAPAFGGEMEVLCNRPYLVNMRTLEPSVVMTLDSEVFRHLVSTRTAFAAGLCADLSARLFIATSNERALAFADVDARLADLLLDYGTMWGEPTPQGIRITLAMSQDAMSRDLAVSRKAVVQSLAHFKEQGLVDKIDGRYVILKRDALAQLCSGGLPLSYRLEQPAQPGASVKHAREQ